MRQAANGKSIVYVLVLAIGMTILFPEVVFTASRSFRSSGKVRAPAVHSQHRFTGRFRSGFGVQLGPVQGLHGFRDRFDRSVFHSRFSGEVGFIGGRIMDAGDVVIIQVPSFAPTSSREPGHTGSYVEPQWVDGGHGVEILRAGYWNDEKQR
ncbi:MAG TPA: hypothetical protein VMR88_04605 [Candidatus Polarisedimenticolaceae bacterium]|nr:hypothetical protein [Candidatus Polarisedimenticolaceae bacterium]